MMQLTRYSQHSYLITKIFSDIYFLQIVKPLVSLLPCIVYLFLSDHSNSRYQERIVGILLICLTPPHCSACPYEGFPSATVIVISVFKSLRFNIGVNYRSELYC